MKKINLIKNPELFQGEKYLKKNKNYFEGWYFKNTSNDNSISFIPGININKEEKNSFIQIITNNNSYYINYDIKDFEYSNNPFYIKIANNYFSKDKIIIDINNEEQNIIINGEINYSSSINIKNNIMGPFSYIPFMECNHAIISQKNTTNGTLNINNNIVEFKNDIGYIEKDWGYSFPKSYIWCQANNFENKNTSFMLSIADIPFGLFNFQGIICSLTIDNEEYRFATYNNTKLIKYDINNNSINIILKKDNYQLNIYSTYPQGIKLTAPVKGKMNKEILETINAWVEILLIKDNIVIYNDTSKNCGLEIVDNKKILKKTKNMI